MAGFGPAITLTLQHEGGLVNNPRDKGKITNFGISQARYPNLDIANLTREEAVAIYQRDYWRQEMGQLVSQTVCNKLFDMSVLMSPKRALMYLQAAVSACGHAVPVDGMWGPRTIAAVNLIPASELMPAFIWELKSHFLDIILRNPSQSVFFHGWIDRVES